jgi:hypothetical protein
LASHVLPVPRGALKDEVLLAAQPLDQAGERFMSQKAAFGDDVGDAIGFDRRGRLIVYLGLLFVLDHAQGLGLCGVFGGPIGMGEESRMVLIGPFKGEGDELTGHDLIFEPGADNGGAEGVEIPLARRIDLGPVDLDGQAVVAVGGYRADGLDLHGADGAATVVEWDVTLAHVGRLDGDPVARCHLPDELREIVLLAILPDAFGQKPIGLVVLVPHRADEPVAHAIGGDFLPGWLILVFIALEDRTRRPE